MRKTIKDFIKVIDGYDQGYEVERWQLEVQTYLESAYGDSVVSAFYKKAAGDNIFDDSAKQKGYLKSLIDTEVTSPKPLKTKNQLVIKKKVFLVHGRDNESKHEISRYIESLGIEVIILHEQVSSGKTIIEKIEHYSNEVDFALVLYSACDCGRGIHEEKIQLKNRARQNVVFEHGYLMAKLGRENVCALVKGEIETPNDINGVVYVNLDEVGAWKLDVTKELKACGYKILN